MCADIKLLLFAGRHHMESLSFAPRMIMQYARERMQMPRRCISIQRASDDRSQTIEVTINGRPWNKIVSERLDATSIVSR